jgi:hypothetical protein
LLFQNLKLTGKINFVLKTRDILMRESLTGKTCRLFYLVFLLTWVIFPVRGLAEDSKEVCVYRASDGSIKQVNSKYDVPYEQRKLSKCFKEGQSSYLAKPQDITLKGNLRHENIDTSLGRVNIRWPRKVEEFFGRSPLRAVTDASQTVARTLKTSAFPSFVQDLKLDWEIVFLDADLPSAQIPAKLVENCHPGWMTPPANIYIVAQRVAGLCGKQMKLARIADSDLTETLLHEFGHAVEFYLLREVYGGNPLRAEGFATWFEIFSAKYSSVVAQGPLKNKTLRFAKKSVEINPSFYWTGDAYDYARASMYFDTLERKRGITGLMKVYKAMALNKVSFFDAINSELYLKRNILEKEVLNAINQFK